MPESPSPTDSLDADRLIFFSDAVIAIAITLLALELPVPTGRTVAEFWRSVRDNDGHYAAFLISFAVIASMWTQHHRVFRFVVRCDDRLLSLSVLWLLTIVLIPSATKLLTERAHDTTATHALRFGFYALLQVVAVATFATMVHRVVSQRLLAADAPARLRTHSDVTSYGVLAAFALSIPLFFATKYAWVLWLLPPVVVPRLRRRMGHSRAKE